MSLAESNEISPRDARYSGKAAMVYAAAPIPETYCAMTVAHAAPPTPISKASMNKRSSPTFKIADTPRNISGTTELPTARSSDAK